METKQTISKEHYIKVLIELKIRKKGEEYLYLNYYLEEIDKKLNRVKGDIEEERLLFKIFKERIERRNTEISKYITKLRNKIGLRNWSLKSNYFKDLDQWKLSNFIKKTYSNPNSVNAYDIAEEYYKLIQ